MNQLARLQQTFQSCVLDPQKSSASGWVSAAGRAAPELQLSVYRYAYGARLREVLANDFPACRLAIGEEQFEQLSNDYIVAHPSHYFSLRDFGAHFPVYVAETLQQNLYPAEMQWLHELSLFEWTLGLAFDAADSRLFNEQDMAFIALDSWPDLQFVAHPSLHRLDFEWNVVEIWQALTADEPVAVTAVRDVASPWLIWRQQLVTRFRSLDSDEQRALDCMRAGGNFNEVCELLAELMNEDEVPLRAAGLLKGWIAQGLISGIR